MEETKDIELLMNEVRSRVLSCIDGELVDIGQIKHLLESAQATAVYARHNVLRGNIFYVERNKMQIVLRKECFFLSGSEQWKDQKDSHRPGGLIKSIIERTEPKFLRLRVPVLYFEGQNKPQYEADDEEDDKELALIKVSEKVKRILKENGDEGSLTQQEQITLDGFMKSKAEALHRKMDIVMDFIHPYGLLRPMLERNVRYLYLIPSVFGDVTVGGMVINVDGHLSREEINTFAELSKWALIPTYLNEVCEREAEERKKILAGARERIPPRLLELVTDVHRKDPASHFNDLISDDLGDFLPAIQSIAETSVRAYVRDTLISMWQRIVLPPCRKTEVKEYFKFYSEHEMIFFKKTGYRDHLVHQMVVYLAGLCVIRNLGEYRATCIEAFKQYFKTLAMHKFRGQGSVTKSINKYFRELNDEQQERLIRWNWFVTATFHDMAYPVEMSEFWVNYVIGQMFNPETRAVIVEQIVNAAKKEKLPRPFGSGIASDIQGRLMERIDHVWVKEEKDKVNWLPKFLDYFPERIAPGKQISVATMIQLLTNAEHGLFSSFVLYSKFLSQEEKDDTPCWKTIFKNADTGNGALFRLSVILSIVPIALHSQKVWEPLGLKMVYKNFPNAFILAFCDLLQESNREELFLDELHVPGHVTLRSLQVKDTSATAVLEYKEDAWKEFRKRYEDKKYPSQPHELVQKHWGQGSVQLKIFHCSSELFEGSKKTIDEFSDDDIEQFTGRKLKKVQLGGH